MLSKAGDNALTVALIIPLQFFRKCDRRCLPWLLGNYIVLWICLGASIGSIHAGGIGFVSLEFSKYFILEPQRLLPGAVECHIVFDLTTLIASFMALTWGSPGSCRPQVGLMYSHLSRGLLLIRDTLKIDKYYTSGYWIVRSSAVMIWTAM